MGPTCALCSTNLNVCAPHLQKHLPSDKLAEVRRVLFGLNKGKPVRQLPLSKHLSDAVRPVHLGCVQRMQLSERLLPSGWHSQH